jgi:hypothetical protein
MLAHLSNRSAKTNQNWSDVVAANTKKNKKSVLTHGFISSLGRLFGQFLHKEHENFANFALGVIQEGLVPKVSPPIPQVLHTITTIFNRKTSISTFRCTN